MSKLKDSVILKYTYKYNDESICAVSWLVIVTCVCFVLLGLLFFFFKQKTAYEM